MLKLKSFVRTEYLDWSWLSENVNAIRMLEENMDRVNWYWLSCNLNAMELLKEYPDKIDWSKLSRNCNAIELLTQNPDKINWDYLSGNPSQPAIDLLEKQLSIDSNTSLDWEILSSNPGAIELFKKYPNNRHEMDKINQTNI
jgi:hypothetical protein